MHFHPITRRRLLKDAAAPLVSVALGTGFSLGRNLSSAHAAGAKEKLTGKPTDFYMAARRRFKTNLLRKGPAPQRWTKQTPPPGVEKNSYQSGGHTLTAWLAKPDTSSTKSKTVIFLHGGFAFHFDDLQSARPYLDAGYNVVMPVLRGENGQPGHFSLFYDEVDDVLAVLKALQQRPDINSNEIFVTGHSVGGTLSLLSGMTTKGFKGIASSSGSTNQVWFTDNGKMSKLTPFNAADENEFFVRSPILYVECLQAPTRYFHGTEEKSFAKFGKEFEAEGHKRGLNLKSVAISGDHFTSVPEAVKASIRFFDSIE